LGRLNPHLCCGLKSPSSELPEQIANLLLRPIDQMPVGGTVDRICHLQHRGLKIFTHATNQLITIELAKTFHGQSPFPAILAKGTI
jgi:hypothetical protein